MIPFVKEKLLENWVLKITAILLAWILWMFIQGESGTVTMVTVPVKVIQVPDGMEISSKIPSTVQVTMRGARQDLTCIINLQNYGEGENKITLSEDNINPKGSGVEVSQVNPSQVTLMLEKTMKRTVPITVPVQGEVADGFEIYEKITNPDKVTITGPRNHINPIEEVSTDIIDLNGEQQSKYFDVNLNFKDGTIRSSISVPVRVEIRVGPRRKMYLVKQVPVSLGDESYVSIPKTIDIRVMAPESLQPDLVPDNFSAKIVSQNLDRTALTVKVKPEIGFIDNWRGKIKEIGTVPSEVTIRKKDEKSSKQ